MAIDYTVDGLIDSVKLRAMVPTSQNLFTDERILDILNQVQYSIVVPWVMSQRQDFFKDYVDLPVDTGTNLYDIPSNTIGQKIVGVWYGRDDGNGFTIDWEACTQVDIGDTYDKDYRTRRAFSYFVSSDKINIFPTPSDGNKFFRIWFYRRPSTMVMSTSGAKVTGLDSVTKAMNFSSFPSSWATNTYIDFTKGTPHFRCLQTAGYISSISGGVVYAGDALPVDLSVGDWVTGTGETVVPQLPYEIWTFLVHGAVSQIFKIMGNPSWQTAEQELQRAMEQARNLIGPRADEQPKKLVSAWW